jgi:uncharacterized protein YjbI with pentapeptide repeats
MSFARNRERAHDLDLHGFTLADVDLSSLSADRLDLRAVDLRRAKLCAARLGDCRLEEAKFGDADWSGATLRMCVLDGAQGVGACFDSARIEDSCVKGADLTRASLRGAKLTETSFARAILCGVILDNAEGAGVEFRGADLSGAKLVRAQLDEADFRGADLRRADLSNGRFRAADFRGAILDDAVFAGADLEGALFDEDHDRGSEATTGAADDPQGFDDALLVALQKALSGLPGALEPSGSPLAEFQSQLRQAIVAIGESADRSPDELTPWLDLLVKMAMSGKAPDVREMLDGACDRPAELQELFATEGAPIAELLEQLQHFVDAIDGASDQPPEEWRSWLEPLVKMTEGGQSLDLNAVIEAVSSVMQGAPPTRRGPIAVRKKRSAGVNPGTQRRRKPPLR